MFKRVADEPDAITHGMADVERAVGLRGRKYYGAFDTDGAEYRVCVELREGDDPNALGLEVGTLPGGRYARVRITGGPPEVYRLIGRRSSGCHSAPIVTGLVPASSFTGGGTSSTCCCRSSDPTADALGLEPPAT